MTMDERRAVEVDVDGTPLMGSSVEEPETEPVQVNVSIQHVPTFGVELGPDGSATLGFFPIGPDGEPLDQWVPLVTFDPDGRAIMPGS